MTKMTKSVPAIASARAPRMTKMTKSVPAIVPMTKMTKSVPAIAMTKMTKSVPAIVPAIGSRAGGRSLLARRENPYTMGAWWEHAFWRW